jgi:hypothetical protein
MEDEALEISPDRLERLQALRREKKFAPSGFLSGRAYGGDSAGGGKRCGSHDRQADVSIAASGFEIRLDPGIFVDA